MTYIIAYIDEKKVERDNFLRDMDPLPEEVEIEVVDPKPFPEINKMIDHLLDLKIDALISDFDLTQGVMLDYSGQELIDGFREQRPEFPCYLRTAYEDAAIKATSDVNIVFSKEDQENNNTPKKQTSEFELQNLDIRRIMSQIDKYRSRIEDWTIKLQKLLEIPDAERTADDNDRILQLDHCLEFALGGNSTIPRSVKEDMGKRNKLIKETEDLISEIRKKLGKTV